MNINEYHSRASKKLYNKTINQNNECLLITQLINEITADKSNAGKILNKYTKNLTDFENIQYGMYKYKDYYIIEGVKNFFEDNIEGYRLAEKTKVNCAPKIVEIIDMPNREMVGIFRTRSEDGKFHHLDEKLADMNLRDRVNILLDFKKMLYNNYVNQGAVESTDDWRITSGNELVLFNWENIKNVFNEKEKNEILNIIKTDVRIRDDIESNIYSIY